MDLKNHTERLYSSLKDERKTMAKREESITTIV